MRVARGWRGRLAQFLESVSEQHAGARDADRGDDRVIVRWRARVRAVDHEAHHSAEREERQRNRKGEERRIAPGPWAD